MLKHGLALALALTAMPVGAQTQAQMTRTEEQSYKSADAAMTREWNATNSFMKKRDSADRSRGGFGYAAALLASQRAWLKYRDSQCAIEGGEFAGGSMQAMARFGCLADLSRERGKRLAALRWQG